MYMQLATDKSPKLTVPYRYLFTGMVILIVLSLGIIVKAGAFTLHYYSSPVLLPLTHLLTLGWITMTIMGAMFQLVPVITERNLFNETIARVVYYIYLAGVAWLVYAFATNTPAEPGAGIISIAVILFLLDAALTIHPVRGRNDPAAGNGLKSTPVSSGNNSPSGPQSIPNRVNGLKKPDLAVSYVGVALFFLFFTILSGSFAAFGLHHEIAYNPLTLLFLHIAVAGIGWVSFIVIGFSFRLVPMFVLSHGYDESFGWTSLVMLVSGLVFLILYFLLHLFVPQISGIHWIALAGGIIMLIGIVSYLLQMRVIYKQRTRRKIEPALWFSICAMGYLLIAGITGVWMLAFSHSFRMEIVYVVTGLFGFAGMYIIGMMHKIVPFLQWYNKYSSKIGLEKVPMTKDMISEKLTWVQLFVFNAGIIIIVAGVMANAPAIIVVSGIVFLTGSILFLWNIANVLRK